MSCAAWKRSTCLTASLRVAHLSSTTHNLRLHKVQHLDVEVLPLSFYQAPGWVHPFVAPRFRFRPPNPSLPRNPYLRYHRPQHGPCTPKVVSEDAADSSGFQIRMKSVFVPMLLFPHAEGETRGAKRALKSAQLFFLWSWVTAVH